MTRKSFMGNLNFSVYEVFFHSSPQPLTPPALNPPGAAEDEDVSLAGNIIWVLQEPSQAVLWDLGRDPGWSTGHSWVSLVQSQAEGGFCCALAPAIFCSAQAQPQIALCCSCSLCFPSSACKCAPLSLSCIWEKHRAAGMKGNADS